MSPTDLIDILAEAQSMGNRFITQIWAKGGRELVGDEARNLLNRYKKSFYHCVFILYFILPCTSVPAFVILQDDDAKS
jgi:hypothetical protein